MKIIFIENRTPAHRSSQFLAYLFLCFRCSRIESIIRNLF